MTASAQQPQKDGREYVRSSDLAREIKSWITANNSNYHRLAARAQLSPRAISLILNNHRQYQTIYLADRLMIAMNKYIYHLPVYYR